MPQTVLDVGNCVPDHAAIRRMIERHFDAVVLQADQASDALSALEREAIDLILVNRKLDCDYSDGMQVIARIKTNERFAHIPVMLVTNYEDHQQQAIAAGAVRGFGKLALTAPETLSNLAQYLQPTHTTG